MTRLKVFDVKISIKKSRKKLIEDLVECLEIINISCQICCKRRVFMNVIATQLRLLLCDGNNSLVNRIWNEVTLPPLTGHYHNLAGTFVHDERDIFNLDADKLPLKDWLKQRVIYNDQCSIELNDLIRLFADKCGAHVDVRHPIGLMFLKDTDMGKQFLIQMGACVCEELLKKITGECG